MDKQQNKKQYLHSLIREYLAAEMRHMIYPKQQDKDYHLRIMDLKRIKIEDICHDINVPCPFNGVEIMELYRERFRHTQLLGNNDFKHYYCDGSEAIVENDGVFQEGTIKGYQKGVVTVEIDDREMALPPSRVRRKFL